MTSTKKVTVHKLFSGLQEQLIQKLTHSRSVVLHPGAKGSASELDWMSMLSDYLPVRYSVDSAFVLDSEGNISDQIDLVVYDRQYSPLLFNHVGARYVPIESVYAVLEVKQDLNKDNIEYAQNKAASVRRLKRTAAPIIHAGGEYDAPASLFEIQAGLLCLDSAWNPTFGKPFDDAIKGADEPWRLNFGCALKRGGFEVEYVDGNVPKVTISAPEKALLFFFLRLLHRLQQLGTAPAIDLTAYQRFV